MFFAQKYQKSLKNKKKTLKFTNGIKNKSVQKNQKNKKCKF